MSPENADNMKPSRHINSEKFNIINKREIDKNNKKKKTNRSSRPKSNVIFFTLIHLFPQKQNQGNALLNLFHYQLKVHVHS